MRKRSHAAKSPRTRGKESSPNWKPKKRRNNRRKKLFLKLPRMAPRHLTREFNMTAEEAKDLGEILLTLTLLPVWREFIRWLSSQNKARTKCGKNARKKQRRK